ncbi:MAG: class flavin-dependent oxidoreductase [Microbacteriaceae bacterium]|nr:class flavin-dependent oxidoreductase [Microbacteriaceae bacterium]
MTTFGMIYQPSFEPEDLRDAAVAAEAAGIQELWVWEDCFKQSGLATLVAAVASTTKLRVGVGVLPMPLRNVAILAMELAAIERMFPGRARFGVGHGVLDWMGQVGERVASPLTLMREYVPALRALLAGERVDAEGRYVKLRDVKLDWPPKWPVKVLAAGEGPKTMALTGEVADGLVITAGFSPSMVREAVAAVRASGAGPDFEVVVYLFADFGEGSAERMERELDDWKMEGERRFAATGTDDSIEATVREFYDAGATTVLLQSRSGETDLPGYIAATGRIAARLRG